MIGRAVTLIVVLVASWHGALAEESQPELPIVNRLIDTIYQPLHREFADASEQWAKDAVDLCQRRPASSAYQMQVQFARLIETYASIELFRTGPLLEDNIQNKLFYWPDKRRIAQRQLKSLLASLVEQEISAEQLAEKSVALQGFTALERLLFTPGLMPMEHEPQCRLIPVVIQNIADMASQLENGWQSNSAFVQDFLLPQADSQYFRTQDEVFRDVFTQIKVGLDIVLDGKLKPLLSKDKNTVRQTPLWISRRTVAMLTGNLRGLRALLLESGLLDNTQFEEDLQIEFDYINHVLLELKPIIYSLEPDGILDPRVRVLMNKLAAVVSGVRYTVSMDVSKSLGISAGFNSEDGD